ncbi:MAG: CDP-alcohol phosphatidyltransferase [Bacteroidetes bacterium]|nr:CDP-alcohol phosphatidyltransferase [Bacteroidota bacterium]
MTTLQDSSASAKAGSSNRFFTISNLLSISRALLTIPLAFVMLRETPESRLWGAGIIVLAALTDKFDGVLARRYNQITEWGKILDPLADKVAVGVVAVVLLILGNIPVWFVVVLLVRDVLIFAGGMYIKKKKGILLQSNEAGKWTVGIVAVALFLVVLNAQSILVDTAIWLSVALLAVSSFLYVKRFNEIMKG